ncbi:MAG TPA: MFS transporter [Verrucomicrobiota bacterium]|nr:MFS transporter [Verrucomicrobiota bacterium]
MKNGIRTKLSVMMFLQYVIWGSWLPLITIYLTQSIHYKSGTDFTPVQTGWIMNTFALSSIYAMFIGGQLADRLFSAERFLAFSHLIGGITMLLLPSQTSFWPFFIIMLIHCIFYVPTLSVTNSICFANLKDPKGEFGLVRLWGTLGWVAAGVPFIFILKEKTGAEMASALSWIFIIAGIASLLLSAFCLTLPHTPPTKQASQKFAPFEAIKYLAIPTILILFIVTYFDTLVLWCHFFWTAPFLKTLGVKENWIMPIMSIGQVAEVLTMAVLGYVLKKLGWRFVMTFGIAAQILRFAIYSISNQDLVWLVVLCNVIHGVCYAFFFASVYIFVDEFFPKDARTSAQSLFNLVILGIGPLTANPLWGWLGQQFSVQDGNLPAFNKLFYIPTAIALIATIGLFIFFKPEKIKKAQEDAPPIIEPPK